MRLLILLLIFSLVSSFSIYSTNLNELLAASCNSNYICEDFENTENCPDDCKLQDNLATDTAIDDGFEEGASIKTGQDAYSYSRILQSEKKDFPTNIVISVLIILFIFVIVASLYSWIHRRHSLSKISEKSKSIISGLGKQENIKQNKFILPVKPRRRV